MPQKKAPLLIRIIVWLILLILLFGTSFFWFWNNLTSPLDPQAEATAFVVQKGESAASVAERLEQQKLIRSSLVFKVYLKIRGDKANIEAGNYKLSASINTLQIIKTLNEGAIDKWVTLLEGWRVEQIAKQLNDELGINSEEFMKIAKPKEGYLFPDTYLINKSATAQSIFTTLIQNFDKKFNQELKNKLRANELTLDQGVILASIVEREGRSDKVRQNIANILLKRFKMGMPLQADATVQYAKDSQSLKIGKWPAKFWQSVTQDDYKNIISPFNTYLSPNLPPSPICNPGLSSLTAVANADSSIPYLFYYVDSQGQIYYAKTLEEHNQNIADYP